MKTKKIKWIKVGLGMGFLVGVTGVSLGAIIPIVLNKNDSAQNLSWYIKGNESESGEIVEHNSRVEAENTLTNMHLKSKVWKLKTNDNKEFETSNDAWKYHMSDLTINKSTYYVNDFIENDETGSDITNIDPFTEAIPVFIYNNKTYKDLLHAQNAWLNDNPMKAIGTGDKSGNTYTQAELDKRDGKFAPKDAVEGLNTKGVEKVGLGDGKTYIPRKGLATLPNGKIISGAYFGYNSPERYYTNDEILKEIDNRIDNSTFGNFSYGDYYGWVMYYLKYQIDIHFKDIMQITKDEMKKYLRTWDNVQDFLIMIQHKMGHVKHKHMKVFDIDIFKKVPQVGLGDGKTYVLAEGYTSKEDGPTGDYVDGAVEGINSKEIKGVGDQSNKTYTKSQIDARDATITAGNNAILGLNEVDVRNTILDIKSNEIEKKWIKNKDYQNIINGVNWNNSWLHIDTQEMFWLGSDKTKAFTTKEKLKEWYKKTNSDYVTQSDSISKVDIKIGDEIITFKSLAHAKNEIIKNKYV